MSQLEAQLKDHGFTPERSQSTLFAPPSNRRFWLRTADFWDGAGRRVVPWAAGGVLVVEASKQTYAPTRPGLRDVVRRPLRVLEGLPAPVPSPRLPDAVPEGRAG
jgi:hypothetical protein